MQAGLTDAMAVCANLVFFANGKKVCVPNPDPETSLARFLRKPLRLTGTKIACGEGGCGACTVMLSTYDHDTGNIRHEAVTACLVPLCSVHGLAVTTIEGVGSSISGVHALQRRLIEAHGSQCGFCTPGMIMSAYALLRNTKGKPSYSDLQVALAGNLCRCTGYRSILEGLGSFVTECPLGAACCKNKGDSEEEKGSESATEGLVETGFDSTQEPIFPPQLQVSREYQDSHLEFKGQRVTWHRPTSVQKLLELRNELVGSVIIAGNTSIENNLFSNESVHPHVISVSGIPSLYRVEISEGVPARYASFGAALSLSQVERRLQEIAANNDDCSASILAFLDAIPLIGGLQNRNMITIGGYIATAMGKPNYDLSPLLIACGCSATVATLDGSDSEVCLNEEFFARTDGLAQTCVISSVTIPLIESTKVIGVYRHSGRKQCDFPIVNGSMVVKFEKDTQVVESLRMVFGGLGRSPISTEKTTTHLVGRSWEGALDDALKVLHEELSALDAVSEKDEKEFLVSLAEAFFFKFHLKVTKELCKRGVTSATIGPDDEYLLTDQVAQPVKSVQLIYPPSAESSTSSQWVGQPIPHVSGLIAATGEAQFLDDISPAIDEAFVGLVLSERAHANIVSVDPTEALNIPGTVAYISHEDLRTKNIWGLGQDQPIFAKEKVSHHGQLIGCLVADCPELARRAAKMVKVEYEDLKPILTIEEAIAAESFLDPPEVVLKRGDTAQGFSSSDRVVEGELHIGGQLHFYMETNAVRIVPTDGNEYEVTVSSQNLNVTQSSIAAALGVPSHRVLCRAKRVGGAFGGKEFQHNITAIPTAVCAQKLQRPVRCVVTREDDCRLFGNRHPVLARYKVGMTAEGQLISLEVDVYLDAGYCLDLSNPVRESLLMRMENGYHVPNMRVCGRLCRTNLPSNTAMRGFGAPQGMMVMENVVHLVAETLGKDVTHVKEKNLLGESFVAIFNQPFDSCTVKQCWSECMTLSDYSNRRVAVEEFNRSNRWTKRGLAVVPVKFPPGFWWRTSFMNQGSALVHIYSDGSVLVSHGGIEMGQGLYTKLIQVAAHVLQIDISKIHIRETNTGQVPNTTTTAGSTGSDLYGMAVKLACEELLSRLKPFKDAAPEAGWNVWVIKAYLSQTSLSATGFYKVDGLNYDYEKMSGVVFHYFTYGVACTEIEVDVLTGGHTILRADIVMDVGKSLNPMLDVGQIEGSYMQGYGMFMLENIRYSPEGESLSNGPGTYKIPSMGTTPREFNVALLKEGENPHAVYSSKGLGEAPFYLSASCFYAVKDAITAARLGNGLSGCFRMDSPATSEQIKLLMPKCLAK